MLQKVATGSVQLTCFVEQSKLTWTASSSPISRGHLITESSLCALGRAPRNADGEARLPPQLLRAREAAQGIDEVCQSAKFLPEGNGKRTPARSLFDKSRSTGSKGLGVSCWLAGPREATRQLHDYFCQHFWLAMSTWIVDEFLLSTCRDGGSSRPTTWCLFLVPVQELHLFSSAAPSVGICSRV